MRHCLSRFDRWTSIKILYLSSTSVFEMRQDFPTIKLHAQFRFVKDHFRRKSKPSFLSRHWISSDLSQLSKSLTEPTHRVNSAFLSLSPPFTSHSSRLAVGSPSNTTVDISCDDIELDHRLHFQVATEHFTHNNERIKLHFKVEQLRRDFAIRFSCVSVLCCSFHDKQIFHRSNDSDQSRNLYLSIWLVGSTERSGIFIDFL